MKLTSVTFKPSAERFPPIVAIDLNQLTPDEYVTLRNLGYDTQLSKLTKRTFEELEGHTLTREFKDVILMQSTGLKDKNGVEIFEGDVLYYDPFKTHMNDSVVVFEKGSFCKKTIRNGKLTSVRFIDSEEYEVIRNVWEDRWNHGD